MTFAAACAVLVRHLVEQAYGLPKGSARPASQASMGPPIGASEYVTVKIFTGPDGDFGTWGADYENDPTEGSTKVIEILENVYNFTASIQFFKNAVPSLGRVGSSPHDLSALDRAARLPTVLASSTMMELMERLGLGLEDNSPPRDIGSMIGDGAAHEDRANIDLTFNIVNQERFLLESFATADVTLKVQEPGKPTLTIETIEVTP